LEFVQQEWAHSSDTLDGRFVHRRVDQAAGSMPAPDELNSMPKLHARSVMVGSDTLGAVARIDLIESDDGRVVPVDYKRGAPPDIPEGAYEPERVQVCLQGLLLREHGYACDYGVLYFAAAQARVMVEFTDALVARTLELLVAARHTAEAEEMPPPLVDSPKCPRCSLVGICLPDEVNLLRVGHARPAAGSTQDNVSSPPASTTGQRTEPRRLVPARDDHIAVYVQGQGYSVGLKGEVLEIRDKGKVVSEARLMEMSQLSLFGNVQLSAQALRELAAREVPIVHLSYGGWLNAVTTPPPHKNIELRRRQFAIAADPAACLRLAQAFVAGKIRNARTLLRRNARALPEGVLYQLAAARHYERAATLADKPRDAEEARYRAADAYAQGGDTARAEALYRSLAAKGAERSARAEFALAELLEKTGREREGQAQLALALQHSPGSGLARNALTMHLDYLRRQGGSQQVLAYLDEESALSGSE